MSDISIWIKSKNKHIKSATCQGANGHPTPHHFGNRRGGILHPKDFRPEYSMWTKHIKDASPYYSCLLINACASAASLGGLGSCSTCIIFHPTHATYKQASPFIVKEMPNCKSAQYMMYVEA